MFIGWKKASTQSGQQVIIQLEIPEEAKRLSSTGRKCRCDKAKVLSIKSINGSEEFETAISVYDHNFVYKTGEVVSVDNFDEDRWNECSTGINFFINRSEAEVY